MSDEPRAFTREECLEKIMRFVAEKVDYWTREGLGKKDACEGLAHSFLAMIDGVTYLPALDLHISVDEMDKDFCISEGSNWHENGMCLNNDVMLHEELPKYLWGQTKKEN